MPKVLNQRDIDRYRADGYHFPVPILEAAEALDYRLRLEAFEARQNQHLQGAFRQKTHLLFTWLDELIRDPRILDVVEDVLGPNLFCWSSSFFIKEPNDPGFVSWHQDSTYWGLSEPDVMTVWVAFSTSDAESGCMSVVPGSHRLEQVPHRDTFNENNLLTRGQEIAVEVDEQQAVAMPLSPGQASLHHVRLFHASPPNRSNDRRIGFAIRYIPTYVRQVVGDKDSATLVRGTDEFGNFEHETGPDADFSDAAVAQHQRVTNRQVQVLYRDTGKAEFRS